MTIINAYAPHTGYLVQSPEEIPAFYELLTETYTRYNTGNNALVIVMGDFNSKLGQKTRGETTNIVGSYGKGKRNRTGNLMAEFMEENNLLATNTIFRKSIFKRITWTKCLQGEIVYNQIDYILLEQQKRHLCEDSQAYRTFLYGSDHFPVITTFNLKELYRELPKGKKTGAIANLEYNKLTTWAGKAYQHGGRAEGFTYEFQEKVETKLAAIITENKTPDEINKQITETLKSVAKTEIPKAISLTSPLYPLQDQTIRSELEKIKKINKALTHRRMTNQHERKRLVKEIRKRKKTIKHKIRKMRESALLDQITNLEANKGNTKLYAIKKAITNTDSYKPLRITQADGTVTDQPEPIRLIAKAYYEKLFTTQLCNEGEEVETILPFEGEPRPLRKPFQADELFTACKKLRNGRATGPDGLKGELVRYGGFKDEELARSRPYLYTLKALVFNRIFEQHKKLETIHTSDLVVLNKPGKRPEIEQTRGITLHNIDRKLLEILLLIRIVEIINMFLGTEQCGYREGRSTTEVLFCHRWLTAMCQKYKTRFNIMGIDLSKAFDCVLRKKLYDMLVPILGEDDLRIMRILFAETTLTVKAGGERSEQFNTTVGIPQGGGLSPIFFILYLEMSMQDFERTKLSRPTEKLYFELTFADDKDPIIECEHNEEETPEEAHSYQDPHLQEFGRQLEPHLKEYNLKMNLDKLEWTIITCKDQREQDVRKLGTRIGEFAEMDQRTKGATHAFRCQRRFFNNSSHLPLKTRMRIYNCYVLPMFTYNIATLGITDTQMKRLDVLHRKQLRIVCRIFYPRRIRNIALYKLTESVPITNMALKYRWKFFGHILRQSRENPPYRIMTSYFDPNSGRIPRQGRTFTNLPITLHKDLEYAAGIGRPPLKSMEDLELIRKFAQRRNEWREMVAEMVSKHNQPPTVRTRKTTRKRQRQENKKEMTKRKKEYKRQQDC